MNVNVPCPFFYQHGAQGSICCAPAVGLHSHGLTWIIYLLLYLSCWWMGDQASPQISFSTKSSKAGCLCGMFLKSYIKGNLQKLNLPRFVLLPIFLVWLSRKYSCHSLLLDGGVVGKIEFFCEQPNLGTL